LSINYVAFVIAGCLIYIFSIYLAYKSASIVELLLTIFIPPVAQMIWAGASIYQAGWLNDYIVLCYIFMIFGGLQSILNRDD
jgi:uncharacterized membrane protein YqaE (UPF0057 family)